ncbi:hypothetical protein GEMRC1_008481 [Eukaryota sp. GEM-RC1]
MILNESEFVNFLGITDCEIEDNADEIMRLVCNDSECVSRSLRRLVKGSDTISITVLGSTLSNLFSLSSFHLIDVHQILSQTFSSEPGVLSEDVSLDVASWTILLFLHYSCSTSTSQNPYFVRLTQELATPFANCALNPISNFTTAQSFLGASELCPPSNNQKSDVPVILHIIDLKNTEVGTDMYTKRTSGCCCVVL